ncbi:MAG: restriction endonuclease subunit S [Aliarcobacter sp.]
MPNIHFERFDKLLKFLPKSKIKAGDGQESGKYPFFKSGNDQSKFIDTAIFQGESLIIGDGGSANINFYDKKFSASDHCYVIQKNTQDIDIKYVYYYLKSNLQILETGFKGAGLKNISKKYISEIKIPLLPLQDQQKIAQLLTQIEELINKREESIKLLDELIKSTFLDMFGDPVLNPRKFKKEKIKKFGKIVTGNTPPRAEDKYYDNNFIEWVKTDNLFDDQLFATEAKEYLSEEGLRVGRKVKAGSLLVTCIAGSVKSIGTSCLVDRAVSFNQQINAIEPYEGIDSYFLYQLFKVSKLYVQNQAGKGMKKIITKSTFEDILFPMPDKDSQKRFGEIFQNVYNLRIIYQNSLTELNNLFGSIAQKAFKGELNVSKIELIQKEQEEITMSIKLDGYRLLEEIKKGDFEASKYVNEHQNYDAIKDMIFKLIEDGKISQKFDDNSKKIILEAE